VLLQEFVKQLLADIKPIPPQKAKAELIKAVAAENDKRKKRERNARQGKQRK
jgi:hypothetical protein